MYRVPEPKRAIPRRRGYRSLHIHSSAETFVASPRRLQDAQPSWLTAMARRQKSGHRRRINQQLHRARYMDPEDVDIYADTLGRHMLSMFAYHGA